MRPALHPDHAHYPQRHLERFVAQPSGKLAGKVTVLLHLGDSPPVPPRLPWPAKPAFVVAEPVKQKKPSGDRDRRAASKRGWQTRRAKAEAELAARVERRIQVAAQILARQQAKDAREKARAARSALLHRAAQDRYARRRAA